MKNTIEVGSKVKYKREFLKSIGVYTGALPFARGVVTELKTLSSDTMLATINWTNDYYDEVPKRVNVKNLTFVNNPETV